MIFTNAILSALIYTNDFMNLDRYEVKPLIDYRFEMFEESDSLIKQSAQVMLLNSARLIMFDIFYATKPNYTHPTVWNKKIELSYSYTNEENEYVYVEFSKSNCIQQQGEENNKIADFFWKQGLWITGYVLANSFNFYVNEKLNELDNTGILSFAATTALTLCECWAIDTWKDHLFIENVEFYAPIINYKF